MTLQTMPIVSFPRNEDVLSGATVLLWQSHSRFGSEAFMISLPFVVELPGLALILGLVAPGRPFEQFGVAHRVIRRRRFGLRRMDWFGTSSARPR